MKVSGPITSVRKQEKAMTIVQIPGFRCRRANDLYAGNFADQRAEN